MDWVLGLQADPRTQCKTLEKVRAYHMTMKEKLAVHRQIEAEDKRKLEEFKQKKSA